MLLTNRLHCYLANISQSHLFSPLPEIVFHQSTFLTSFKVLFTCHFSVICFDYSICSCAAPSPTVPSYLFSTIYYRTYLFVTYHGVYLVIILIVFISLSLKYNTSSVRHGFLSFLSSKNTHLKVCLKHSKCSAKYC